MSDLPFPPSKTKTAARYDKLAELIFRLKTNSKLEHITTSDPVFSERVICAHVQHVLNGFVTEYLVVSASLRGPQDV